MIAKMLSPGSYASKIGYVTREKHDKKVFTPDTWSVLGSNGMMGETTKDLIASMEMQGFLNPNITDPCGHIVLSFSPDDKPHLTDKKMLEIAGDYIKDMGLDKTQWVAVRHYETDCPHCHIVFNMVGDDGTRQAQGRNSYKSKHVCKNLTNKYGIALPKGKTQDLDKLHGLERAKAEIRKAAFASLRFSKNWTDYARNLSRRGMSIQFKYRKNAPQTPANIQGFSFRMDDYKVKASDISDQFRYKRLDDYFKSLSAPKTTTAPAARPKTSILDSIGQSVDATASLASSIAEPTFKAIGDLFHLGLTVNTEEEAFIRETNKRKKRKKKGRSL